jgi:membrane-associated phospholipid phosphatase
MLELSNPWYPATLLGAPELWAAFALLVFVVYMGLKVTERRKKVTRKTGDRVKDFLFLLVPTLVLVFVVVMAMKGVLDVPRQCVPCITELAGCNPYCPLDSSLPSGHAATAFAGFTAVWLFAGAKRKWLFVYAFPFIASASRIMLGVHTWLDVFAGSLVGVAVALAVWEIDKRID